LPVLFALVKVKVPVDAVADTADIAARAMNATTPEYFITLLRHLKKSISPLMPLRLKSNFSRRGGENQHFCAWSGF
jgi:hypothetical protein